MSIEHGKRVRSIRDMKICGTVVGFGTIMWPADSDPEGSSGDQRPVPVYMVKPDNMVGSMANGPTVLVLRVDMVVAD